MGSTGFVINRHAFHKLPACYTMQGRGAGKQHAFYVVWKQGKPQKAQ